MKSLQFFRFLITMTLTTLLIWNGNLSAQVTANFDASPTSGCGAPLTVQFTDQSSGAITDWLWEFGDGNISTLQNPTHIYNTLGSYTVGLWVSNATFGDSLFKVNYIVVGQPSISAQASVVNVSCNGGMDGVIELSNPSGGTGPYEYGLSPTNTSSNNRFPNLSAGNHTIYIEDVGNPGCFGSVNVVVTEPTPVVVSITETPASCLACADGKLMATASGGIPPYSYLWGANTGFQTTAEANSLLPGTYCITVTDANGCVRTSCSAVNVAQGNCTYSLGGFVSAGVSCFGAQDAAIDITVTNGIPPYTYLWSTGDTSQDIFNLSAGNYSVTVEDSSGCPSLSSFTILEPSPLSITITETPASCPACTDGSLSLSASGGTPPYTYDWDDPNNQTTATATGLQTGTYCITVTDANGCSETSCATLTADTAGCTLSLSAVVTLPSTCGAADGAVDATALGGTLPYTYAWNTGDTTEDISGLQDGDYWVTVTDAQGCMQVGRYAVFATAQPPMTIIGDIYNPTCDSCENGFIDISVSGGVQPYGYSWSNGVSSQQDIDVLFYEGTYSVTVTDSNGCNASQSFTVVNDNSSCLIDDNAQVLWPSACGAFDASITLNASGGVGPYLYQWDNNQFTSSRTGLAHGMYKVTITDANGCAVPFVYEIGYRFGSGGVTLDVDAEVTPASCSTCGDGSIVTTTSSQGGNVGGTAPYTYLWTNVATTKDLSGLDAGIYCLTVTDVNGCVDVSCYEVETDSNNCNLVLTMSSTPATCAVCTDGTASVVATGGTPGYDYLWDATTGNQTTQTAVNLATGQYSVTVVDSNGCTGSGIVLVGVDSTVNCFTPLGIDEIITHPSSCNVADGSIDIINITSGAPPYTYEWSHGPNTEDVTNLPDGVYRVTVTDSVGCIGIESYTLKGGPEVAGVVDDASCPGCSDGTVDLTVSGGAAPYTYQWSNGGQTQDMMGLVPGSICVTVTDANGCMEDACFVVGVDSVNCNIVLNEQITDPSSCIATDGAIDITPSGGTPPYFFAWSNNANSEDISGLSAGTYGLTLEDTAGCRNTYSFTLIGGNLTIVPTITHPSCPACADGIVSVTVSGGVTPYTYEWGNGDATPISDGLPTGLHCVTVTDANGCIEDACFTLMDSTNAPNCASLVADAGPDQTYCIGSGAITLGGSPNPIGGRGPTALGGTVPYTYQWSPAASLSNDVVEHPLAEPSTLTIYTVLVTDANGCTATDFMIAYVASPGLTFGGVIQDTMFACDGNPLELEAFGANNYFWNTGDTGATLIVSPPATTTYSVTLTAGSCVADHDVVAIIANDCVWPGDADDDGVADNNDVLAIGVGYGATGPARNNSSLVWIGQPAQAWNAQLQNGANYKHLDTDGSGFVDSTDVNAIYLNYGQTHLKQQQQGSRFVDPALYYTIPNDTVLAGSEVDVVVSWGRDTLPVDDAYGIAFTVNYDNTIVEEGTMRFTPASSWLGTLGTDMLSFSYDKYANSKLDVAQTRVDQLNKTGFGPIGIVSFTMKDDISGKSQIIKELNLSFSDVRAISADETELTVFSEDATIVVTQEATSVREELLDEFITVYPNPTRGQIFIQVDIDAGLDEIAVYDVMGRQLIVEQKIGSGIFRLDASGLENGTYFLRMRSRNETLVKRLVVIK